MERLGDSGSRVSWGLTLTPEWRWSVHGVDTSKPGISTREIMEKEKKGYFSRSIMRQPCFRIQRSVAFIRSS
ncbi:MAG: hypothetical protein SCG73_02915, partial [Nitrospiraceae bacterium]|nr:hypothetical protein [Nitrospiraceae bacterium]